MVSTNLKRRNEGIDWLGKCCASFDDMLTTWSASPA